MKRIKGLLNTTAYDVRGNILGTVTDIFTDETTGQPDFANINYGIFGNYFTIVPLRGHRIIDGHLHMAFTKEQMKTAPAFVNEGKLSPKIRTDLLSHFGLENVPDVTIYIPLDNSTAAADSINPSLEPAADGSPEPGQMH